MILRSLTSLLLLLLCRHAVAIDFDADDTGRYLTGYQPSYFTLFAIDGIDTHMEFSVSLKYPLDKRRRWYFTYTGAYDFYVYDEDAPGRDSGPVVSRLQNPGIFYKYYLDRTLTNLLEVDDDSSLAAVNEFIPTDWKLESISTGWFHESNGQTIDGSDTATFNATVNAADYVSRGWDYLGIDIKHALNIDALAGERMAIYTRMRFHCGCQAAGFVSGREDNVTVFKGIDDEDIRDYDGLRLVFDHHLDRDKSYGIELRTGMTGADPLENWSFRVEATFRPGWPEFISHVPINLFYFNGYGTNISTYHIRDDYVGIGIKMW